jgi:hypothetical protein
MIRFLFWNINKKPLQENIARLTRQHGVDVLMLAECDIPAAELLQALNPLDDVRYHYAPSPGGKIQVFTAFSSAYIPVIREGDRYAVRRLILPGLEEILLAVAHVPSKAAMSDESQRYEAVRLAETVRKAEADVGHDRTVLVGDLNMNPFDSGMVSAMGLHGVMTRDIARKGKRTVQHEEYPFFYNPMWGLLGDGSPGPPGTYYYRPSEHVVFFWHMLDQVLVRPALLDRFGSSSLRILDNDGTGSFLTKEGIPDGNAGSDHLPLMFSLNL